MTDLKATLLKLNQNLNILQEREARYAGNAPLDLLNQIKDHQQAIDLTHQAITGELDETEWRESLKPLLLAYQDGQVVNIEAEIYIAGDLKSDTVLGDKVEGDRIEQHGGDNVTQIGSVGGDANVTNTFNIPTKIRFAIAPIIVVAILLITLVMVSGYDLRTLFEENTLKATESLATSTKSAGIWDYKNCTIPVSSSFKPIYDEYKDYLGCATESALTIPFLAEQVFQGGHLFWREDKNELYVIYDRSPDNTNVLSGAWLKSPPEWHWDGSYDEGIGIAPPSDELQEPIRGFGWVWRTHLGGPDGDLGWALDKERGFYDLAKVQVFERGFLFRGSDPKVYCLLDTGEFFAQR